MAVIKRDRKESGTVLVHAITQFVDLLRAQDEDEAAAALTEAAELLRNSEPGTADFRKGLDVVVDAFEGDHELMAYTHQRNTKEWTVAEELSLASSRVISLAKRMRSSET